MSMKKCATCSREFAPSSRHKSCPACRGKNRSKKSCVDCQAAISYKATRCAKCSGAKNSGPEAPRWNGGKGTDSRGYVIVYSPNHPRAHNNRIPEHTLVMESALGRFLLPGENVHHKNGVKSDNRPENLELWVTTQPAGQRPEDLVQWAKEIIEKYGAIVQR